MTRWRSPNGRRAGRAIVLCAALVWMTASLDAQRQGRAQTWWRVPEFQRQLNLTSGQIESLDAVFYRTLPSRRAYSRAFDQLQEQLRLVIQRGEADDAAVMKLSDAVEEARARRNTARTLMLIEVYRILTPTQRLGLAAIQPRGRSPAAPRESDRAGR